MSNVDPVPAVSIAIVDGDRVLLVKRGRAPSKGLYAFPGGRVESGETLEQAVRRELMEETGLATGAVHLLELLDLEAEPPSTPFRLHVFTARHTGGDVRPGDDAEEAAWFALDEVARLPTPDSVFDVAKRLLSP